MDSVTLKDIKNHLEQLVHTSIQLNDNGYFTINNIKERDVNTFIRILENDKYVMHVSKIAGRFDFANPLKASQGNPDRYWTIRGNIKVELEEEITIHDTLNPKIWNEDNSLKDIVRVKIENIVDTFADILREDGIDLKIEDIYLLGSNANYNYTDESDLDIHIIADESFDCDAKHLPIIYQAYKSLFNLKYDIKIKGINVELYVENKDDLSNVSTGVYSFNDGWIKDPTQYERPEIDDNKLTADINKWKTRAQEVLTDPSVDSIEKYIDDIYDLRTESISNEGEFGIGNLVFKEIRRQGILDNLKDLKFKLLSKELSLESLEESLEPELYHGTTVKNAFLILQEDTLKVGKMYANKEPAVCFTRHLDNINSYKFAAIFVIDRDKLKANYKITPITDYKNVVGDNHGARYTATDLVQSKAEEVVKQDITNIRKYIKKILIASDIIDVFKDYCKKNNVDISDLIIEEI